MFGLTNPHKWITSEALKTLLEALEARDVSSLYETLEMRHNLNGVVIHLMVKYAEQELQRLNKEELERLKNII